MNSIKRPGKAPIIIGHRGARLRAPENTMAGFRKGVELGARMLECDVHLSKDDQLIVIHDETVDRTTNGQGRVRDLTWAELSRLNAGWSESIPSLDQLVAWVASQARLGLAIEIKGGMDVYPGIGPKVARLIDDFKLHHRAMVISFDHHLIASLHHIDPRVACGILFEGGEIADPIARAKEVGAMAILPSVWKITPQLVRMAHLAQLMVFTWTANTQAEMRRARDAGVDGIATDVPDDLARLLSNSKERRAII